MARPTENYPRRRAWPLAGAALGLIACASEPAEPTSTRPKDLVVIVLDALPAGELSCYGYERPTTPNLDALAERSLRFEEAFATASYTLASTASLFTGLSALGHGCVDEAGQALGADRETLAEVLEQRGFATAGFSCNPHISPEAGFDQGFERFEYRPRDAFDVHRVPAGMIDDALGWWSAETERRRFLYLHLLPPHVPYDAPAPFDGVFGADRTDEAEGGQAYLRELNRSETWLRPDDPRVERLRARYDAGLAYADDQVGKLLQRLEAAGGLDDVALVVLSDHGESFGEHGRILHGGGPYTEAVRVPLLIAGPGLEPSVRAEPVRTRDLAATLCELLEVPRDDRRALGSSFLTPRGLADERPAAGSLSRSAGSAPIWALRTDRWTYLLHSASGREELYDRASDPGEQHDLSAAEPATRARLKKALATALGRENEIGRRYRAPEAVDAHSEELRAIGYLGDE